MIRPSEKIREIVSRKPAAEAALEEAGIDYWFDWERSLESACDRAGVDAACLIGQIDQLPDGTLPPQPPSLTGKLVQSATELEDRLLPAIRNASELVEKEPGVPSGYVLFLLRSMEKQLMLHRQRSERLLPVAQTIDTGRRAWLARQHLRELELDHVDLAQSAEALRYEAAELRKRGMSDAADAIRQVIHLLHQHIKLAHNFVFPALATHVGTVHSFEPW